jgi:hypothetical protein
VAGIVIPNESSPLTWPPGVPRTAFRRTSQFRQKSVGRALTLVYEELRRLKAQRSVISSNLPPRLDGSPSVRDRDVEDVGVAVYWVMPTQRGLAPYCLPCDRWETVGENLLAIGNTIKTFRDVERWGAIQIEQAFAGVKALPSGDEPPPVNWREILGAGTGGWPDLSADELLTLARSRYHKLARQAHPDQAGSTEATLLLNAAMAAAEQELKG